MSLCLAIAIPQLHLFVCANDSLSLSESLRGSLSLPLKLSLSSLLSLSHSLTRSPARSLQVSLSFAFYCCCRPCLSTPLSPSCSSASLACIHRDFRAANILVAGRDPLHVVVADFGVSHQLRVYTDAAAALGTAAGAATQFRTVLKGGDALCPFAWVAPEVIAGSLSEGVTATPASDVYMLGGLMFEVLTCGLTPYYWMSDAPKLIYQRRRVAAGELFRPAGLPMKVSGLAGLSMLQAAKEDDIDVPWALSMPAGAGSVYDSGVGGLIDLMERCLNADDGKRPALNDVQAALQGMLRRG